MHTPHTLRTSPSPSTHTPHSLRRAGLVDYWLMPWLVFHAWLSTLALVRHSAPHIPWRAAGAGWDQGAAAVSGCVTVTLPAPLEAAINHLNYPLPHQISPAIPFYHTKK